MNISYMGWLRFRQSKGEAVEAMVQEPREEGVLLKVDASKLGTSRLSAGAGLPALSQPTKTLQNPDVAL